MDAYENIGSPPSSFASFYNNFVSRHNNKMNIQIHLVGAIISVLYMIYSIITFSIFGVVFALLILLAANFIGHLVFEKNHHCLTPIHYAIFASYKMAIDNIRGMSGKKQRNTDFDESDDDIIVRK